MIYLDSSALVKLIAPETESAALSEWIRARWEHSRATSALSRVDVLRGFRETGPAAEDLAAIVLDKIESLAVSPDVLAAAADLPVGVSTTGAVHLATARAFDVELLAYVSYDAALLEEAARVGLPTASPGLEQPTTPLG
ncbi:type II toxin-antitoxin system VapC family toxin [Salinifilum aidingensis]